jgi:citrate synthase
MKREDVITILKKKVINFTKGSIIYLGGNTKELVGKRAVVFILKDEVNLEKEEAEEEAKLKKEQDDIPELERELIERLGKI